MTQDNLSDIPLGFCQCGCGQRTAVARWNDFTAGYVAGRPKRYRRGHFQPNALPDPPYRVDPKTGCWIWLGAKSPLGYGRAWDADAGRVRVAHQIIFEREYGPIPEGLELDHLCRNPECVRPHHLEAVTHAENMRRYASATCHERWRWGVTREQAIEIRRAAEHMSQQRVAERFGIEQSTVSRLLRALREAENL